METKKGLFPRWRWLGLIPIAIWLYNLIINLTVIADRFGPANAPYAWHYNLWSCPMMGLLLGIGILMNNKFLVGAGALWGLYPVFLSDILPATPDARLLAEAQGFSIPFIKLTPEYQTIYESWVGSTGVTLIVIEEFATHWLGNFLFGVIGLVLVGINGWSFLGTAISFLFTAWFTQDICPFAPPEPAGAPSLFVQAIPMTVIWIGLNVAFSGIQNQQDKRKRNLYIVLAIYWLAAILAFNTITVDAYIPLLLLGYLVLFAVGSMIVKRVDFLGSIRRLFQKRSKGFLYAAFIYGLLFSLFFFVMMRPNLIQQGVNPWIAFTFFGLLPFLVLLCLALFVIPLIRNRRE